MRSGPGRDRASAETTREAGAGICHPQSGKPAITGGTISGGTFKGPIAQLTDSANTSFTDVAATDYYCNAVIWAAAEGVTNGANPEGTVFNPTNDCTRAQIVSFLYRFIVQ